MSTSKKKLLTGIGPVGNKVGYLVGYNVGSCVGSCVFGLGVGIGRDVGLGVGFLVGDLVGAEVSMAIKIFDGEENTTPVTETSDIVFRQRALQYLTLALRLLVKVSLSIC